MDLRRVLLWRLAVNPTRVLLYVPAYLVSIGPAVWLWDHGIISASTYYRLYRPLAAAGYYWPAFRDVMIWYTRQWG